MSEIIQTFTLPLVPLRDVVVFPSMVVPLFVGREKSINALEAAMDADKKIVLVTQKVASRDEPSQEDIYQIGTLATILQLLKLPDGTVKVLVEGKQRVTLNSTQKEDYLLATVEKVPAESQLTESRSEVFIRTLKNQFEQYAKLGKKVTKDTVTAVNSIDDLSRLLDTIAAHVAADIEKKQEVLETADLVARVELLISLLNSEIELFEVEKRIRSRVQKQVEKNNREYYLNEKIKAIQKELSEGEGGQDELGLLEQKIKEAKMPAEAEEKTLNELQKLRRISPMAAEAGVIRGYIDWMCNVPWSKRSRVVMDLAKARKILDQDHYGLDDVKERVIEFLAVQKRVKKLKGPILCLVGPPGVGKTSLGESIAKATNRKFVRMALGGVRDEAEIRGHRRTYIGSMPGRLIQRMSKVGVKNPLFLLDEIDKMGMDHRGDPASALLEVLDPEQNHSFNDHYLDTDYDLSEVMFICTANSLNIPGPLLDRMEIIRIPGYTEAEKVAISERYLLPKQLKNNGLKEQELTIEDGVLSDIIRYYTREAGVRGLDKEIAKVTRKAVKAIMEKTATAPVQVNSDNLSEYLGVRRHDYGQAEEDAQVGLVTGLAWTQVGGELLNIEVAKLPGKGGHIKTGSLGDVMQESIQAAMTVVKSRAQSLGISLQSLQKQDLHIHVPEGATPKDGPSAGIGMCTAMVSALTGIAVNPTVAMTGEITLRGQVLRIGGLKEKLLAAHRGGIKTVIIPMDNKRDLEEIPDIVLKDIEIKPVKWVDEVLEIALIASPKPISDQQYLAGADLQTQAEDKQQPLRH